MNDNFSLLRTSDNSAHAIASLNFATGQVFHLHVRVSARVVAAGTSALAVNGALASEWMVSGGYNGSNIITSTGTTGVESTTIATNNGNAVLTFTVSGNTLTINVQWTPATNPTLDWAVDVESIVH
jgi:hypothetical protein